MQYVPKESTPLHFILNLWFFVTRCDETERKTAKHSNMQ